MVRTRAAGKDLSGSFHSSETDTANGIFRLLFSRDSDTINNYLPELYFCACLRVSGFRPGMPVHEDCGSPFFHRKGLDSHAGSKYAVPGTVGLLRS